MVRTSTQKRDDLYDDQFDFPTFCRRVPCFVTSQTQIAGRSLGGTRHFMPGILPHNFRGILTPLVRVLYCTVPLAHEYSIESRAVTSFRSIR